MLIVETIKSFLEIHSLADGYRIQPYEWDEKKNSQNQRYIVIQPQPNGSSTLEDEVDNVRILVIGKERDNKIEINQHAELIKKSFVDNHTIDNVWYFDIVGRPIYMKSKEQRPIFELNIVANKTV